MRKTESDWVFVFFTSYAVSVQAVEEVSVNFVLGTTAAHGYENFLQL